LFLKVTFLTTGCYTRTVFLSIISCIETNENCFFEDEISMGSIKGTAFQNMTHAIADTHLDPMVMM